VIPVDEVCARSPKNKEQQDCKDAPGSKQEEADTPSAANADDDHFTSSKPSLFTIDYLMKMPSAVPSRREKTALKL
jgi:hypothetical protein